MRLDVVTIFPEYLQPLRHALLGKAIEQGRLEVGVHDLRQWATDAHKSVDDSPFGGGPGMVMKPEVWGPALDDVALGTTAPTLDSSLPHLNRPRHDELEGVEAQAYGPEVAHEERESNSEDSDLPLLLVPTRLARLLPRRMRGHGLPRSILFLPVGVTRASTSAWLKMQRSATAFGRYPSGIMCSLAGRSPYW